MDPLGNLLLNLRIFIISTLFHFYSIPHPLLLREYLLATEGNLTGGTVNNFIKKQLIFALLAEKGGKLFHSRSLRAFEEYLQRDIFRQTKRFFPILVERQHKNKWDETTENSRDISRECDGH